MERHSTANQAGTTTVANVAVVVYLDLAPEIADATPHS